MVLIERGVKKVGTLHKHGCYDLFREEREGGEVLKKNTSCEEGDLKTPEAPPEANE